MNSSIIEGAHNRRNICTQSLPNITVKSDVILPQINGIPQITANVEFVKNYIICEIANQENNVFINSGSEISCCNSNVLKTFPELKNKYKEMFAIKNEYDCK